MFQHVSALAEDAAVFPCSFRFQRPWATPPFVDRHGRSATRNQVAQSLTKTACCSCKSNLLLHTRSAAGPNRLRQWQQQHSRSFTAQAAASDAEGGASQEEDEATKLYSQVAHACILFYEVGHLTMYNRVQVASTVLQTGSNLGTGSAAVAKDAADEAAAQSQHAPQQACYNTAFNVLHITCIHSHSI